MKDQKPAPSVQRLDPAEGNHTCHTCRWVEFASGDTDLCCYDSDNERVIDTAVDPQPWCPLFAAERQER